MSWGLQVPTGWIRGEPITWQRCMSPALGPEPHYIVSRKVTLDKLRAASAGSAGDTVAVVKFDTAEAFEAFVRWWLDPYGDGRFAIEVRNPAHIKPETWLTRSELTEALVEALDTWLLHDRFAVKHLQAGNIVSFTWRGLEMPCRFVIRPVEPLVPGVVA